ncbi:MAG: CPBP family intramembrane metalloprotease [Candidatus Thermoplasmatota archaeon]|nr:CPBP family intramembrane metalloprotease [Candidatus Thermoplasmatota archaeon]
MGSQEYQGQGQLEDIDSKWHGVPPAGRRPAPGRTRYIIEIVCVLIVEFIIWGIYRYFTAPIYGEGFNIPFFIGHIIAAPTIHLGPILLYWKFIRKEPLFHKDDPENGKFMSFNLGPFKLTKNRLMTAVLVGLFGGVVWRLAEMAVLNATSVMMGGTRLLTLKWLDVFALDAMDFPTFFMMTFVMFFIVGPVEEFEFRSFTHDQSQRVLPKWAALVFSSVFFGFSHIPIALFIYKMTFVQLIFAEISWMAAGATFGALYMWSRNIFACIVMHGIGNWQLSVYWIQGRQTLAGLTEFEGYMQSLAESILANAFMIMVFYLIHRFYWAPQQRGEAAFGGLLMRMQRFFYLHDSSQKHIGYTTGSLAGVTVAVLIILFSISAGLGVKDISAILPEDAGDSTEGEIDLTKYYSEDVIYQDIQNLAEGSSHNYNLTSTRDTIVQKIQVDLTWTDETNPPATRIRPHDNTPDEFRLVIGYLDVSIEEAGENPEGSEGNIHLEVVFPEEMIRNTTGEYSVDVDVFMVDAGMWVPSIGPGLVGLRDPGNEYSISITVTNLISQMDLEEDEEEPEEKMAPTWTA